MGFRARCWTKHGNGTIDWDDEHIFLDKNQQPDDVINEDGGLTNQFWLDSKVYLRKFLKGQFVIFNGERRNQVLFSSLCSVDWFALQRAGRPVDRLRSSSVWKKKVGKIIPTRKHLASVASKIYFLFDETKARVSALFWGQKRQPEPRTASGCSAKRVAALRDDPCPLAWGSISTPTCLRLRCRPWFDVGWSFIWVWVTVYPLVN
jgi:hypothetical protein